MSRPTRPWHDSSGPARAQESEGEEAAEQRVTLAEDLGRGNLAARQSRVRLQEVRTARGRAAPALAAGACASAWATRAFRRRGRRLGAHADVCGCDGAAQC